VYGISTPSKILFKNNEKIAGETKRINMFITSYERT
jgi:hypothetical protein